jgi:hypothetical protein
MVSDAYAPQDIQLDVGAQVQGGVDSTAKCNGFKQT